MKTLDLGSMGYLKAFKIQKNMLEERKKGAIQDTLMVVEHPHVFTIGRIGSYDNLLVDTSVLKHKRIKIHEIDRGGDITYHGPGQVIAYPVISIKEYSLDVRKYIRSLEEIIIQFLAEFDVAGRRVSGSSGVWAKDKKIGFVGIGISKWVTYHGISININTDLSFFSMIRSCGIKGIEVTSLAKILSKKVDIENAKKILISKFNSVFKSINAEKKISVLA